MTGTKHSRFGLVAWLRPFALAEDLASTVYQDGLELTRTLALRWDYRCPLQCAASYKVWAVEPRKTPARTDFPSSQLRTEVIRINAPPPPVSARPWDSVPPTRVPICKMGRSSTRTPNKEAAQDGSRPRPSSGMSRLQPSRLVLRGPLASPTGRHRPPRVRLQLRAAAPHGARGTKATAAAPSPASRSSGPGRMQSGSRARSHPVGARPQPARTHREAGDGARGGGSGAAWSDGASRSPESSAAREGRSLRAPPPPPSGFRPRRLGQ